MRWKGLVGASVLVLAMILSGAVALADDVGIGGITITTNPNGQKMAVLDFKVTTNDPATQSYHYIAIHKRGNDILQVLADGNASAHNENACDSACFEQNSCLNSCAIYCGTGPTGYTVGGCVTNVCTAQPIPPPPSPPHISCICQVHCPPPSSVAPILHPIHAGDTITATVTPDENEFVGDDPSNNSMTVVWNP